MLSSILQVHRLATLKCRFYIFMSAHHLPTYKDTLICIPPNTKPHFFVSSDFNSVVSVSSVLFLLCFFLFLLCSLSYHANQCKTFREMRLQNNLFQEQSLETLDYWCNRELLRCYSCCSVKQQAFSKAYVVKGFKLLRIYHSF